jgi:hypothetical protein
LAQPFWFDSVLWQSAVRTHESGLRSRRGLNNRISNGGGATQWLIEGVKSSGFFSGEVAVGGVADGHAEAASPARNPLASHYRRAKTHPEALRRFGQFRRKGQDVLDRGVE